MDFVANKEKQIKEMLACIGVNAVDELWKSIPKALEIKAPLEDDGLSEYEGSLAMAELAKENSFADFDNYLGAGAYEHHCPAFISHITGKSEFLTAYTPYQAECSQGMLQIIFEFQSAICALSGLDIANASLYDGASAVAEASLMALRKAKTRNSIICFDSLHPHYREVVEQYLCGNHFQLKVLKTESDGRISNAILKKELNDDVAGVILQEPNFFGNFDENSKELFQLTKECGALSILVSDLLSFGLFNSAKELGANISVGDCQSFGLALNYGGPYVGYIACQADLARQMPGRIVGMTTDRHGNDGFVLTLQAREQHIRREKATSNICSNQALAAFASLLCMLWYGKRGSKELALTNYQRANYLRSELDKIPQVESFSKGPCFNEFVIKVNKSAASVKKAFLEKKIVAGLDLSTLYPHLNKHLLIAVTETKNKKQLDRYVHLMREVLA